MVFGSESPHDSSDSTGRARRRSKPYPFPNEYRAAIADAGEFAADSLKQLQWRPGHERRDGFLAAYDRWQEARRQKDERISDIPLLIALAAMKGDDHLTLRQLLQLGEPVVWETLERSCFGDDDVLTLGTDDTRSRYTPVETHRVSYTDFWHRIRESLRGAGSVSARVSTGEFGIMLDGQLLQTLEVLPGSSRVHFLGRPHSYQGAADFDVFLATLGQVARTDRPRAVREGSQVPSTNGQIYESIRSLVAKGTLQIELLGFHLDEPHVGLIQDRVLFVQQHHGPENQAAIVRIDHPSERLLAFARGYLDSLMRTSIPLLPTLHLSGPIADSEKPPPPLDCACGGELKHGRFSHRTTTKEGRPVAVDQMDGYRCQKCGLVLFEPAVAHELERQINHANSN